MLDIIAGAFVIGLLLMLGVSLALFIIRLFGGASWLCRNGWHADRDFLLHTKIGLTGNTESYLAFAGKRIHQCKSCGRFEPSEGRAVWEQWQAGGIKKVGGGIFTSPKMTADLGAMIAIAQARAETLHASTAEDSPNVMRHPASATSPTQSEGSGPSASRGRTAAEEIFALAASDRGAKK